MSTNKINKIELELKEIKKYGAWLRVQGAYVGEPTPDIYGLAENEVISSNDATSLYPTSEILSNIGYETLYGRVYDAGVLDNLINLFKAIEKNRDRGEAVITQASQAFSSAIKNLIKNYTKRKSVQNKKEFTDLNEKAMMNFFYNISEFLLKKDLERIFKPETDYEYFLLKSNLFPLFESINWLSDKNKGYSEVIVDYVFHQSTFDSKYGNKKLVIFTDINSTKTQCHYLNVNEIREIFKTKLLNPYGTLYLKHKEKLAYTVSENIKGLKRRKKVKNTMLCLEGIIDGWNKLTDEEIKIFIRNDKKFKLTEEEISKIFIKIDERDFEKKKDWRISSLIDFEFDGPLTTPDEVFAFILLRAQQLNSTQLGIKVTLNSGYGITGLITYIYSNILIANSITTCGKIYGIKLFQKCTNEILDSA